MGPPSHFINGQWVTGQGEVFASFNPATDQTVWSGAAATGGEVDQAVAAARGAFGSWAGLPLDKRVEHVRSFAQQLTSHQQDLAEAISRETGKPLWESRGEVGAMIGKIDLSIAAYQERRSPTQKELNGMATATRFKPHGVCAVLGPFNLPGHLPNGHIVPAVIAGNTVVFKPSENTPGVGQRMMELWEGSGLPPGVVNMVQGDAETGIALSQHDGIDGLFFTGSSRVGLALSRFFADQPGKILALEMGGNNPLVVWEAGDLDAASCLTVQSAYITAGQRCTCARRLILRTGRPGDRFLDRLERMIGSVRVGPYTNDPQPFMGPLISRQAAQKMLEVQHELLERGARSIVKMRAIDGSAAMLSPGLIDVTDVVGRGDEEFFGPLLQVIRVDDFDVAIEEANRTRYGLAAGLISDQRDLYEAFYRRIRAGVVNWNRPTTGASGSLPFGGVGLSGNHRPSGYYAVDYCSCPVASIESPSLSLSTAPVPGIDLTDTNASHDVSSS